MRIIFIILGLLVADHALAGPIQDIRLKYTVDEKKLHVEIDHVSRDEQKDNIRKIIILLNKKEAGTYFYRRQPNRIKFEADFDIEAKPGDELAVMAYLSEGGMQSAVLVVEIPTEDEETDK